MYVIGYVRVSKEAQSAKGQSLEEQKQSIIAWCRAHEHDMSAIFEEAGESAKSMKGRPAFGSMVQFLSKLSSRDRSETVVVATKLDRLFRNTREALEFSDWLEKEGLNLATVHDSIDTTTAFGRFFFVLMAALATLEREQASERTRRVMGMLKQNGKKYGPPPFGLKEGPCKTLLPNRDQLETLDLMSRMRKAGYSFSAIARILNTKGVASSRGGRWYASNVKEVLLRSSR